MLKSVQKTIAETIQRRIFYSFLGLVVFGAMACDQGTGSAAAKEKDAEEETLVANTETSSTEVAETEYVCPMRCPGSGADEPGICPVCKMLIVRSVEVADFDPENARHTKGSVYNLNANWLTQDGDQIQLEDLSDNYQMVCMIFTRCPQACPDLIGDMLSIDEALEVETKEKLNYLLVTIDPDNDTPERLTKFANVHNLDTDRWTLLQGEKDKILELSNLLGVEYKQYENGSFGHTNYLILLDRRGQIIYRLHGIHVPHDDMVDFMHEHI